MSNKIMKDKYRKGRNHMKKYLIQIDLLKAFAIISVILLHTLPRETLYDTFAVFHIWQAVPIFFILSSFNTALTLKDKGYFLLRDMYNKEYFYNRIRRILYPFIVIFLLSLLLGYYKGDIVIGKITLLGYLPFTGPGNYYISIMFQFILLFPILYRIYLINPKLLLLITFVCDFLFQLTAARLSFFVTGDSYYYSASIFRYLSALGLGIWISTNYNIFSKRNHYLFIGFLISLLYLIATELYSYQFPYFLPFWGNQNVLSFMYPLFIVLMGLKYLPKEKKSLLVKALVLIGRGSYHIFLVQIIYFAVLSRFGWQNIYSSLFPSIVIQSIINLMLCISLGIAFYLSFMQTRKIS